MVISKHPLRFILIALTAGLPVFSFANIVSDSTKVHAESVHLVSDSAKVVTETATTTKEVVSKEDLAAEERAEFTPD